MQQGNTSVTSVRFCCGGYSSICDISIISKIIYFNYNSGKTADWGKFCCIQWSSQNVCQLDSQEFHSGGWSDGPGDTISNS